MGAKLGAILFCAGVLLLALALWGVLGVVGAAVLMSLGFADRAVARLS